ncbi:winged helix-turn-helix transcriptional regulator [Agrobacterium tumefaciens]|uniref:winged helix-turn-helix transcriptional regulator n=1 Tax=Agrobacterium tumefaciens TaxID=358 RepID=UPI001572C4FD|nr:helix-turn-helix domain-containing protein [Agrobacterium tumefaciens]NTA19007.1 helix-turn-helix transcriptional regulator [Agrobacterium tumefaciens]WCK74430.1 helix-turn-helix domain-containing protein [Agrobacterium tumefaciens]
MFVANTLDTVEAHDNGPTHDHCRALGTVLDRIADKWTIMAVGVLSNGPLRFNAMVREIGGVSQRMLTLTLRNLEKDGLVTRTVYPTIPPRVDYELTPLGRTLIGPLGVLSAWAEDHLNEMESSRAAYERRKKAESLV